MGKRSLIRKFEVRKTAMKVKYKFVMNICLAMGADVLLDLKKRQKEDEERQWEISWHEFCERVFRVRSCRRR